MLSFNKVDRIKIEWSDMNREPGLRWYRIFECENDEFRTELDSLSKEDGVYNVVVSKVIRVQP